MTTPNATTIVDIVTVVMDDVVVTAFFRLSAMLNQCIVILFHGILLVALTLTMINSMT